MPVPDQVRDEGSGIQCPCLDSGFRRNDDFEVFNCRVNNIQFRTKVPVNMVDLRTLFLNYDAKRNKPSRKNAFTH
jgi:hypothetical protein